MKSNDKGKQCGKCNKLLPFNQFYKDNTRKDKLTYACKSCRNTINKQYHKKKGRILVSLTNDERLTIIHALSSINIPLPIYRSLERKLRER